MKRKIHFPKWQPATMGFIVLALIYLLSGCQPTLECGSWIFNGTPESSDGFSQFPLNVAFTYTPANCGQNCTCNTDCMIQMVWVYDATDGIYIYPTSSYAARATSTGRVIDRIDGAAYGYYGLLNDGITFYTGWNTTGSNGTANTLFDNPSGWPNNTYFYALDAAVCFKSTTCQNSILGYYFWSWTIDNDGNAAKFIIGPAWQGQDTDFQSALAAWNAWAPHSGTENPTFPPGQSSVSHAQPFPTLTDL